MKIREPQFQAATPACIYLLKVNNRNTRTRCEICSNLTIKAPERRHWRPSGIFFVNFEHVLHLVLVFLLIILNMAGTLGIQNKKWKKKFFKISLNLINLVRFCCFQQNLKFWSCCIFLRNWMMKRLPANWYIISVFLLASVFVWPKLDKHRFDTAHKMKFSVKDFFRKCDQIRRKMWIWSRLLKKSLWNP